MLRKNPTGHFPEVSEDAYVDHTAVICGKVIIEADVFIGPYTVIRADEVDENGEMEPIIIGSGSNVQDGVVIHSKDGGKVLVGRNCSIAHRSIVHGPCVIGDNVFLGFNSVVFDCSIGDGCVIRHNSVVDGCDLPAGFHLPSTTDLGPGYDLSQIPRVEQKQSEFSESVVEANKYLARGYKKLANEF